MSQTMSNEIQTIHYCTILSAGQWDFLLEGRFSPLRQKCLYRLMNGAVRTRTAYRIKGIDIVLEVGQVAAGKSSVSCPLKPSDSAPLKHSTMPP